MQEYLSFVPRQWDDALLRLKAFVEDFPPTSGPLVLFPASRVYLQ